MNAWFRDAEERLNDLLRMPGVHNSYGCPNPGEDQVTALIVFLSSVPDGMPRPVISPDVSGKIEVSFNGPRSALKASAQVKTVGTWSAHVIRMTMGPVEEIFAEGFYNHLIKEFLEEL